MREVLHALRHRFTPRPIFRLAIVSSPRSGNTWLRAMLAEAYQFEYQRALHRPSDLGWRRLSPRLLLQLHWPPTHAFRARLARHRFRVITLARHPLDLLISVMRFSSHEPETAQWLNGRNGDESAIHGAAPMSKAFLDYAVGPRAAVLLGVGPRWWGRPGVHCIRYEDLVRDPIDTLEKLLAALGKPTNPDSLPQAILAGSFHKLRADSDNQHFWKGQPGVWKKLLTADAATRIAAAHPRSFQDLGYDCDPDPALTAEEAQANWRQLN
jgi:hypothetical protein